MIYQIVTGGIREPNALTRNRCIRQETATTQAACLMFDTLQPTL